MTLPETISADYTLRPSELAEVLALLVEARQPTLVWGPPGAAKSMIARHVAAAANRRYVDVRALLLDPVDLRGIPWRDSADRTRWAPPVFLPPSDDPGLWLINLEELPSAVPMVQAALYQLFLERKCGEYALPEGASLIACGNGSRCPPLSGAFLDLLSRTGVSAASWSGYPGHAESRGRPRHSPPSVREIPNSRDCHMTTIDTRGPALGIENPRQHPSFPEPGGRCGDSCGDRVRARTVQVVGPRVWGNFLCRPDSTPLSCCPWRPGHCPRAPKRCFCAMCRPPMSRY